MKSQVAAIPFRRDQTGGTSVLLVRSRTRKRWIIPKGKIGPRMLPSRSAEREAFEEAGVLGKIGKLALGSYRQGGDTSGRPKEPLTVYAFALEVTDELSVWREMHQRERRWFALDEALTIVRDREIRKILRKFAEASGV